MEKKKEKKARKQDEHRRPPVETALDFRARERSADEALGATDSTAPDGISGSWE